MKTSLCMKIIIKLLFLVPLDSTCIVTSHDQPDNGQRTMSSHDQLTTVDKACLLSITNDGKRDNGLQSMTSR